MIVVDEIVWTGNLGSSILRVQHQQQQQQQPGDGRVTGQRPPASVLEVMPQDGHFLAEGAPADAVKTFLTYSLEQIEAMIDLVRGDLDRCSGVRHRLARRREREGFGRSQRSAQEEEVGLSRSYPCLAPRPGSDPGSATSVRRRRGG